MKALIQRVNYSKCVVDGKLISSIKEGILIFLGIKVDDTLEDLDYIINKITNLRIFEDENGKTNKSIQDVNAEIMLISQFTLYADTKKGNRPSFIKAARPEVAKPLYEMAFQNLSKNFIVKQGIFGADMKINLENSGPFTILLQSERD